MFIWSTDSILILDSNESRKNDIELYIFGYKMYLDKSVINFCEECHIKANWNAISVKSNRYTAKFQVFTLHLVAKYHIPCHLLGCVIGWFHFFSSLDSLFDVHYNFIRIVDSFRLQSLLWD